MAGNDGNGRLAVESGDVGGVRYWICRNRLLGQRGPGYWTVYVDASCMTVKDGSFVTGESGVDALLDVHGGCTYFGNAGGIFALRGECDENLVVAGWDYMHGYDLLDPSDFLNLSSRQTLDEVRNDVRSALECFLRVP